MFIWNIIFIHFILCLCKHYISRKQNIRSLRSRFECLTCITNSQVDAKFDSESSDGKSETTVISLLSLLSISI